MARVFRRLRLASRRAAKPVRTGVAITVRRGCAGAVTNSVPLKMVVMLFLISFWTTLYAFVRFTLSI